MKYFLSSLIFLIHFMTINASASSSTFGYNEIISRFSENRIIRRHPMAQSPLVLREELAFKSTFGITSLEKSANAGTISGFDDLYFVIDIKNLQSSVIESPCLLGCSTPHFVWVQLIPLELVKAIIAQSRGIIDSELKIKNLEGINNQELKLLKEHASGWVYWGLEFADGDPLPEHHKSFPGYSNEVLRNFIFVDEIYN